MWWLVSYSHHKRNNPSLIMPSKLQLSARIGDTKTNRMKWRLRSISILHLYGECVSVVLQCLLISPLRSCTWVQKLARATQPCGLQSTWILSLCSYKIMLCCCRPVLAWHTCTDSIKCIITDVTLNSKKTNGEELSTECHKTKTNVQ